MVITDPEGTCMASTVPVVVDGVEEPRSTSRRGTHSTEAEQRFL